ncbi:MAG: hypothetical protein ABI721_05805 [Candidatus Dojkabacteria bacterium]
MLSEKTTDLIDNKEVLNISEKSLTDLITLLSLKPEDQDYTNSKILVEFLDGRTVYLLIGNKDIFILPSNRKLGIDPILKNDLKEELIKIISAMNKECEVRFVDESDMYLPDITLESNKSTIDKEIDNLRKIEASLLSRGYLDPGQVRMCIYGTNDAKEADKKERSKSPELNNPEIEIIMKNILKRIGRETNFLNEQSELGIIDFMREGLPSNGEISTGGNISARYSWGRLENQGNHAAVFILDKNPNSKGPNIGIGLQKPSFSNIVNALFNGHLPYAIDAFTEEICHAIQHKDGNNTYEKIPVEGQAKRLHTLSENSLVLKPKDINKDENSSSKLINYTRQFGRNSVLLQTIRSYGYRRKFDNLKDFLGANWDAVKSADIFCVIDNTFDMSVQVIKGEDLEKEANEKCKYILESFDKLRALDLSELDLCNLASHPGDWVNGVYKRIEEVLKSWQTSRGYTDEEMKKVVYKYFLEKRIAQLKTIKIVEEELLKLDFFKQQEPEYIYLRGNFRNYLKPGEKVVFDV